MFKFPIQQIIDNESIPDEREKDVDYWHPSSFGGCARGVYLERKGVPCPIPFDARTYRIFELGHVIEDIVAKKLIKAAKKEPYNFKVEYQKPIIIEKWKIRGTLDLKISMPEGDIIYDIKSINSRKFHYMRQRGGADKHYLQQVWLYMYAENCQEGRILYVSKDDQFMAEYPLFLTDKTISKPIIEKIKMLNACWESNILPPPAETFIEEGGKKVVNWQAKYCRYHSICLEDKDWLNKALKEINNDKYARKN